MDSPYPLPSHRDPSVSRFPAESPNVAIEASPFPEYRLVVVLLDSEPGPLQQAVASTAEPREQPPCRLQLRARDGGDRESAGASELPIGEPEEDERLTAGPRQLACA